MFFAPLVDMKYVICHDVGTQLFCFSQTPSSYSGRVIIRLVSGHAYVHKQDILVKPSRDLSLEQHLWFDAGLTVKRSFFTPREHGEVNVTVWVPISGIAAGQSLPVLCTVNNFTSTRFGGLLFILTRIDLYRSTTPVTAVKAVRTDICRVARMVDIFHGKYEYYAVLKTDKDNLPTNQFYQCTCLQVIYELWVSVQGCFPRYSRLGYPNITTRGIPIIIGTEPLVDFDENKITAEVFKKMYEVRPPMVLDELPEDEEMQRLLNEKDSQLDYEAVQNLNRQLIMDEKVLEMSPSEDESKEIQKATFNYNLTAINKSSFFR